MAREDPADPPAIDALVLVVSQWLRQQMFDGVRLAGYHDLTPAHVALVRYRTLDGRRPVEIAERMHITRQSVHDLLGFMELRGYLQREADASNGRARIVRLTQSGRRLELDIRTQAGAAEARIAALIGEHGLRELRSSLHRLAEQVGARRSSADGTARAVT